MDTNGKNKVWCTIVHKINLGNYESFTIEAGYSQTAQEGEDPIELISEMEEGITDFVLEKANRLKGTPNRKRRRKQ